ncbi:LADA_0G12486g1_1 [Lachancea dasiensis]|uniref:LADA_0G12486g1_1 n=1 Tax=Lachancea dasiensis TaxID=1072105 RepID=A0A1G4JVA5_9SACH|nr:LADA_0G12486g1_1 [Lachancea dasiensis]
MSSCIFILDEQLNPLILKNFKSVHNCEAFAHYFKKVYKQESGPIISHRGIVYVSICRDGLFYVSVVLNGLAFNVMAILVYLSELNTLLKRYLRIGKIDKTSIMDNFNLVYELLDESSDYGIPQLTDYNIIRDFIKIKPNLSVQDTDSHHSKSEESDDDNDKKVSSIIKENKDKSNKHGLQDDEQYMNSFILRATTQAISWRPKGIYYAKNELFVDIIESQVYLVDLKCNQVRKNFIQGKIICRSYLSGMPKVKMCINKMLKDKTSFLERTKFHQCVALDSLDNQDFIGFIPPDGEFQLCEYKLKRHINDAPIVKVINHQVIKHKRKNKIQVVVTVEPHFKAQNSASSLKIKIPLDSVMRDYTIDLRRQPRFKSDIGSVAFNLTERTILWDAEGMKGGHGEKQYSAQVEFFLFDEVKEQERILELKASMDPPPLRTGIQLDQLYAQVQQNGEVSKGDTCDLILLDFEVPYYACSGLKVEYLKVEENQLQYQSFPWVRYKTINDQEYAFQI